MTAAITTQKACMLSALICDDCGVDKSGANLVAACKAGGVSVKSSTADVFAKLLENVDLSELLGNLSCGGGGAAPAAGDAPAAAAAAPAAAAAAPAEESDEDMGDFGLFD